MNITYQNMMTGEETEVSKFISSVFQKYVAPDYCHEGIQEFNKYIEPEAISKRQKENNILITAKHEERITGAIEIRDKNHIALLFVAEEYQQRGIAKTLLKRGIEKIEKAHGKISDLSVNSSLYAVEIYKKLGFKATDKEQKKNGIRYTPMRKEL